MSTEDYLKYEVFTEDDTSIKKNALYRPSLTHMGEKAEATPLQNEVDFAEYDMDEIRANPDKGTFDIYYQGELKKSYPSTSGKPGETDRTKENEGPTPSGTYYIDPNEASEVDGLSYWLRRMTGDWGYGRVVMHPEEGTETHGRDNFFIHGGEKPGSLGCQDIGNNDKEFFYNLRKSKGKIKVTIE